MDMSQLPPLNDCFSKDITSLQDFKSTIEKIKETIIKVDGNRFLFFYRGDDCCAKVQSKLFKNDKLQEENVNFNNFDMPNSKVPNISDDFYKLAFMQHYGESTRLLDFTTDPLIALRFACGPKDKNDCPKKITIYAVESDLNAENSKDAKIIEILMEFVKSDSNNIDFEKIAEVPETKVQEILLKDYFIAPPTNFPFERINRQKGSFLFMGNRTDAQLFSDKDIPTSEISTKKVKHQLSPSFGRGFQYDGYVGVLTIAKEFIPTIRDTLDCCQTYNKYNIDYLMETNLNASFK